MASRDPFEGFADRRRQRLPSGDQHGVVGAGHAHLANPVRQVLPAARLGIEMPAVLGNETGHANVEPRTSWMISRR